MDFSAMKDFSNQAKEKYKETEAYKEYEEKSKGRSSEDQWALGMRLMRIFAEFAKIKDESAACEEAQALVKKLQEFITENYYNCTDVILEGLGRTYAAGGEMTQNIDNYAGEGTASFANEAIKAFLSSKQE